MAADQEKSVGVAGSQGRRFPYNNQIGLKKRSAGSLKVEEMCKVL